MDLKNKNVLIFGAGGSIGRVLSIRFALVQTNLILVGKKKDSLNVLKKKLIGKNKNISTYQVDVTQEDSIKSLAKRIENKFKNIDILINAFGVGIYKNLNSLSFEEWEESVAVNLNGVFLTSKYFLPLLNQSQKAYVIALGSGMGKVGFPGRSAYCASKFGLRGLMLSLAKEFEKTNIRFVLLTLGSVLTSFGPLSLEEKIKKQEKGKKYLQPSDLAHTIVSKIENDTLETEISIYPSKYYKQSKKGKS